MFFPCLIIGYPPCHPSKKPLVEKFMWSFSLSRKGICLHSETEPLTPYFSLAFSLCMSVSHTVESFNQCKFWYCIWYLIALVCFLWVTNPAGFFWGGLTANKIGCASNFPKLTNLLYWCSKRADWNRGEQCKWSLPTLIIVLVIWVSVT